jgi:hypothetical protein
MYATHIAMYETHIAMYATHIAMYATHIAMYATHIMICVHMIDKTAISILKFGKFYLTTTIMADF